MSAHALPASGELLDELEEAMAHGTLARRVETLRRVTDLFLGNATSYSNEQTDLFDDVFTCLVQKMEMSARALLSNRLAPHASAPPRIIHKLAFDDAIAVAAPALTLSPCLDDKVLVSVAQTKSQDHLLAISKREALSTQVTDVLVDRGNTDVVRSTVLNKGAEFSDNGFERLVERSGGHDDLGLAVGQRDGIPRHHLLRLIAKASDTVRNKLNTQHASALADVRSAVQAVASRMHLQSTAESAEVLAAQRLVSAMHDEGKLNEYQVAEFARNSQFEETSAAIALLSNTPYADLEAMVSDPQSQGVMVVAKILGFSWPSLKAVLDMRARLSGQVIADEAFSQASYDRLKPSIAQQVLRFHKMQKQTAAPLQ